jgi:hypothetical protein
MTCHCYQYDVQIEHWFPPHVGQSYEEIMFDVRDGVRYKNVGFERNVTDTGIDRVEFDTASRARAFIRTLMNIGVPKDRIVLIGRTLLPL